MNYPFITRKTALDVITPLQKILDQLQAIATDQQDYADNAQIERDEAEVRRQIAVAESVYATNLAAKLEALLA